jgi:hypothetical protein
MLEGKELHQVEGMSSFPLPKTETITLKKTMGCRLHCGPADVPVLPEGDMMHKFFDKNQQPKRLFKVVLLNLHI